MFYGKTEQSVGYQTMINNYQKITIFSSLLFINFSITCKIKYHYSYYKFTYSFNNNK